MRHVCSPVFAVVILALVGCGRSPDALIARQIDILDKAGDTLATIMDEASAKAAAPRLASLRRQIDNLIPRVKALQLKPEQRKELEDQHRDDMNAALEKYETQLARVLNLDLKVGGLSELDQAIAK
ncbi:MAG TPA: hypothetical protein VJ809_16315 [Pirellulales bacterium]|jgi:hypothetical protein|nr:hypothetical protein [Pirellulales bacterium]